MPTTPTDLLNRALDEIGYPDDVGDIEFDGTPVSIAARRMYLPLVEQLLSAAHWNFARKVLKLICLGDVSGAASTNTTVEQPWSFMYGWPNDCLRARFLPQQFASTITPIPPRPAPFLVSSINIPTQTGTQPPLADSVTIQGRARDQQRVIYTNVPTASLVYTELLVEPDAWTPMFQEAFVALLGARLTLIAIKDRRDARATRDEQLTIARGLVNEARVTDGNEGWTIIDHMPDWIRIRTGGASWGGPGVLFYGWDTIPFMDGASVY